MQPPPIPSIEWEITTKCNYKCDYCCQKFYTKFLWKHSPDKVVDSMLNMFNSLDGEWLIKISGGEPIIHPRFFEICKRISDNNHKFATTTNFSLPIKKLEQLLDTLGESFLYLTASLHPTEITDVNEFIEKAIIFNKLKPLKSSFTVTSVLVENQFELIKDLHSRFQNEGIKFEISPLKVNNKYVEYKSNEINNFVETNSLRNVVNVRHQNLFGTKCFAGNLFYRVNVDGNAVRCYNIQPGFLLGNVTDGSFKPFNDAKPCLSHKCTCTVPANRNMIRFGEKTNQLALFPTYIMQSLKSLYKTKDFSFNFKKDK